VKKYAQILADMEHKIASGHYRAGQRVPSVREAAQQYGVSPGTIVKAYAELETRHAIYSIPQSGYYVVDQAGGENAARSMARLISRRRRRMPACFRTRISSTV